MSESWAEVSLGDVADVNWGDTKTTKSSYTPSGHQAYSASGPDGFLSRWDYDRSGVVVSAIGAQCGKTWYASGRWSCIKNTIRVLASDGIADDRFLFYATCRPNFFPARGSAQPFIAQSDARAVRFLLPPLDEQRRIAAVLGALDDLIEVNRKLGADCRKLRQALVQSAMSAATDSQPLSELARFVNGKNFTKDAASTGRPVIRTPELRRGPVDGTIYSNATPDADFIATAGDILFVWSGSLMVDRWVFEDGLVNQHIFKVISNGLPDWFIHCAIERQMPWFLGLAADKATTMGHIQRAHLDAPVPVPPKEELQRLGKLVQPLWDQELECALEVRELTSARDELLPLLLSGRVRVGDVAA